MYEHKATVLDKGTLILGVEVGSLKVKDRKETKIYSKNQESKHAKVYSVVEEGVWLLPQSQE